MIYSKDDIKRMLGKINKDVWEKSFYFKNDNLPPRVVMTKHVEAILKEIEDSL